LSLSALRDADRIIVVDGGTVTENDSPTDLLATDGADAKLRSLRYQVPA
jgi:ABC-type multidrug transport system fused ATPase/permease subunit